MIIAWASARYDSGNTYIGGAGNHTPWNWAVILGPNVLISLFNGLTTQRNLTGVGP